MGDRRNFRQRAAALSRVIATMAAQSTTGISEPALAEATALAPSAVHRIVRRLAWKALIRRVARNTWTVRPFVTRGYTLETCPTDL